MTTEQTPSADERFEIQFEIWGKANKWTLSSDGFVSMCYIFFQVVKVGFLEFSRAFNSNFDDMWGQLRKLHPSRKAMRCTWKLWKQLVKSITLSSEGFFLFSKWVIFFTVGQSWLCSFFRRFQLHLMVHHGMTAELSPWLCKCNLLKKTRRFTWLLEF